MLATELKDKIGRIWNTFWANGMTNPLAVMEQITFLLFMKLLDDNQIKLEANANRLNVRLEKLAKLKLPLPPIGEQRQFASFVAQVDKLEFDARRVVEKLDMLYRSKLQEYFS